jgi:hypothetical protein
MAGTGETFSAYYASRGPKQDLLRLLGSTTVNVALRNAGNTEHPKHR